LWSFIAETLNKHVLFASRILISVTRGKTRLASFKSKKLDSLSNKNLYSQV